MVHEMRRRGIRIDQAAAEQARDLLLQKRDAALASSPRSSARRSVWTRSAARNGWRRPSTAHSIDYPRTKKGNPSFKAGKTGWMHKHPHWLPQLIAKANKYNDAGSKFLEGHILEHIVNGRIHAEIHPHRADDGKAPARCAFQLFRPAAAADAVARQGAGAADPRRLSAGGGRGVGEAGHLPAGIPIHRALRRACTICRARKKPPICYRTDPDADFHALVATMTGLERESAKVANFAKIFGAGVKKFAEMIGKPLAEAQTIYTQYDRKLPFVSHLSRLCQREAKRLGYTELYDGARRHWDNWEAPR